MNKTDNKIKTQGERLREIRNTLNLSQEEFGKVFNTSKQYISKLENNLVQLNNEKMVILATSYNVNINYILTGKGSIFIIEKN